MRWGTATLAGWMQIGALILLTACTDHPGAEIELDKPSKPELPLTVIQRRSDVGVGYVLQLSNRTNRYLTLRLSAHNPTLQSNLVDMRVDIGPNGFSQVGWMEGWTFASGDSFQIEHAEYETYEGSIP